VALPLPTCLPSACKLPGQSSCPVLRWWNTSSAGSVGCGNVNESVQEQEGQRLNCLFSVEDCQRHMCLRQQIIKRPLFIATSVEIFLCVYVCVCVYVLASNLAMVTQHKWAALSLSLSWSLLLLTGTQKKDETRADGLGVLRNINAKGCLITRQSFMACWTCSRPKRSLQVWGDTGGCDQLLEIFMVSAFGWSLKRRSRNWELWGIVQSVGFCVKSPLPKSKGIWSTDVEGTVREVMLVLLGISLRAFCKWESKDGSPDCWPRQARSRLSPLWVQHKICHSPSVEKLPGSHWKLCCCFHPRRSEWRDLS